MECACTYVCVRASVCTCVLCVCTCVLCVFMRPCGYVCRCVLCVRACVRVGTCVLCVGVCACVYMCAWECIYVYCFAQFLKLMNI